MKRKIFPIAILTLGMAMFTACGGKADTNEPSEVPTASSEQTAAEETAAPEETTAAKETPL